MPDIVIYRTHRQKHFNPEVFPAIVTKTYDDDDYCDLTVFTTTGTRYVNRVRYSGDDESENTWGWNESSIEDRRREPEKEPAKVEAGITKTDTKDEGKTPAHKTDSKKK